MKAILAMLLGCACALGEELVWSVVPDEIGEGGESMRVMCDAKALKLTVRRKMKMAAEAGNFQVLAVDAGGKEVLRAKGLGEMEKTRDGFACFMEFPLEKTWEGNLTVKVAERGRKELRSFTVERITQEEADRRVVEGAEGDEDPFAKENAPAEGLLDPVAVPNKKGRYRIGGKAIKVLPEGLLMPGKTQPWLLKGFKGKPDEVRGFALRGSGRYDFKGEDGVPRKLWIYEFAGVE